MFISIIISILLYAFQSICDIVSVKLTNFEKHQSWNNYRKFILVKRFVFNMMNVILIYIFQFIFSDKKSADTIIICIPSQIGTQFAITMIVNLTLMNILEIALPLIKNKLYNKIKKSSTKEEDKPEFDISNEYMSLLYSQFLIFMGMITIPLISGVGMIYFISQYYIDRYKMIHICQKPHIIEGTMKNYLFWFSIIIGIMALFTFPYGGFWILGNIKLANLNDGCNIYF